MNIRANDEYFSSAKKDNVLLSSTILFIIFLIALPLKAFPSWYFESPDNSKLINYLGAKLNSIAIDRFTNHPHIAYGSGHLYHAYFDGTSWHTETADNSRIGSLYTSIAVDSNGKVHIAYYGFVNRDNGSYGEVRYATNKSGEWETAIVESYLGTNNQYYYTAPSIAVDSSDKVHITYEFKTSYSDPVSLKYATDSSGTMVVTAIDSWTNAYSGWGQIVLDKNDKVYISYTKNGNPKLATNASGTWAISALPYSGRLAIDSSYKLHIAYSVWQYGSDNSTIYHATNASGTWVSTVLQVGYGDSGLPSIALDSNDKVHITYDIEDASYYDFKIKYATNASGSWVISTVGQGRPGGYSPYLPVIDIDSNNKAYITHYKLSNYNYKADVIYATNASGLWVLTTMDSGGPEVEYPSVAMDSNNKAHISYYDNFDGVLKYATNASGSWVTSVIGLSFGASAIAVDSNGKAHISHFNGYQLLYSTNTSGSWITTAIDSSIGATQVALSSIAIDSNNKAHISYRDRSNTALKYATNASGSWVTSFIDPDGYRSSIAIDSDDNVHIAYDREWMTGVRYTTNESGSWVYSVVAPQGSNPCLVIDAFDNLHIAYMGSGASPYTPYIKYLTNKTGSWVTYDLGSVGWAPSLGIDTEGAAHIIFYNNEGGYYPLKYATNKSGSWIISNVDMSGGSPQFLSIDSDDNVHIAYKGSISDLRYASLEDNCDGCPPVSTYPYVESFESGWGVWAPVGVGDFEWTRINSVTPSSGTGPAGAQNGDFYLYTEASSPNYPGKGAEIAAAFDFSFLTAPKLGLYYHMYGAAMGMLYMDIYDGSNYHALGSITGQQQGLDSEPWSHAVIDLSAYAGLSNVKIIIGGITGSSFTSDMAIDGIEVFEAAGSTIDYYCDEDGDGYYDMLAGGNCIGNDCPPAECRMAIGDDCDDGSSAINPDTLWYPDADGDGYGNPAAAYQQCTPPAGPPDYVLSDGDYNDNDPNIYPGGPPVRIAGTAPLYYPSLQAAYDAAEEGDSIQVQAMTFIESLSINLNKTVNIVGGYDTAYISQSGSTTIQGNISVTDGELSVENVILQ